MLTSILRFRLRHDFAATVYTIIAEVRNISNKIHIFSKKSSSRAAGERREGGRSMWREILMGCLMGKEEVETELEFVFLDVAPIDDLDIGACGCACGANGIGQH